MIWPEKCDLCEQRQTVNLLYEELNVKINSAVSSSDGTGQVI